IMLDRIVEYNNNAVLPNHMGFVFNLEPVTNEIAACTNVVMEYRNLLRDGELESEDEVDTVVDEFIAKLEANNVQKVIDEAQSQVDAWLASR
ncbi:MAG: DUF3502 domain-containing protein, partial [Ruminococcaceae bacterium]|nr:DUF3502 domain-containing protein [Oscillospiraceae bacterium]